ncbi:hypothetical protein BH09MYX1_BH09MYX1_19960 [soil metagenome]
MTSDVLARWRAADFSVALSEEDRNAVDACEGARASVVELSAEASRDLLHALAVYGRALAASGGSPTLAGATVDGLELALGLAPAWRTSGRATVAEGFAGERADQARRALLDSWAPERCFVLLGGARAAVACSVPSSDADEVQAWAEGLAHKLNKARVRSVVLDRAPPRALLTALEIGGIAVEPRLV